MNINFEKAQSAFEKGKYEQARTLYGLFLSERGINPHLRDAATFMVTYLFLKKFNLKQASNNFRFYNPKLKSELLPKEVRSLNLAELMKEGPFEALKQEGPLELDMSGYGIESKDFQRIISSLKTKKNPWPVEFGGNKLTEQDVNTLLDYYLTFDSLAQLDLEGLPIDYLAMRKLESLLEKANQQTPATDKSQFLIRFSQHHRNCDFKLLSHTLRKIKNRPVYVEIVDPKNKKTLTLVSAAVLQDQEVLSCENRRKKYKSVHETSSKILTGLIQQKLISKTGKANLILNVTKRLPQKIDNEPDQIQRVLYDEKGELFVHILNHKGRVIVDVKKPGLFSLSSLKDYFTCQSLTINAPVSNIVVDCKFEVTGDVQIFCQNFTLNSEAEVKADKFTLESTEKCNLAGQLDSSVVEIISSSITLETTATLVAPQPENSSKKSSVSLKAQSVSLLGGRVDAYDVKIESQASLKMPENFRLKCEESKITGEEVIVKGSINGNVCTIEADKGVKVCSQANIEAKKLSVISDDIVVKGDLSNEELELHANQTIVLDSNSGVTANSLLLSGTKAKCLGDLQCDGLTLQVSEATMAGQISSIKRPDNKETTQGVYQINASAIKFDGEIETSSLLDITADKLFFTARSKLNGQAKSQGKEIIQNKITCNEKLYVDDGAQIVCVDNLKVKTKDLTHYGLLKSETNLFVEINGCGEIHDSGKVLSDGYMNLEGCRCWNSGDVDAKGPLNISFDIFFINGICDFNVAEKLKQGKLLGKLRASQVAINTAFFFGMLSDITADNNVQLNAFLNLYVGLINGQNISRSTLAELDLGFNITAIEKIKSMLKFMREVVSTVSSEKTLAALMQEQFSAIDGKALAMNCASYVLQIASIAAQLIIFFAPQIGFVGKMLLSAANILLQLGLNGASVKQEIVKLVEKYQSGVTIHPREFYPLILNIKNIALAGCNAAMMGKGLPSALQHIPKSMPVNHQNLLNVLPSVVGLFGGSVSDQSLLEVDLLSNTLTGLSSSMNAVHLSALSQKLAAVNIENSLFTVEECNSLLVSLQSISTEYYRQHDGINLVDSEMINATEVHLDTDITARSITVIADQLSQHKNLHTDQAYLNTKKIEFNGHVDVGSGSVAADELSIQKNADVRFKNASFNVAMTNENGALLTDGCGGDLGHVKQATTGDLHVIGKEVEVDGQKKMIGFGLNGAELRGKITLESTAVYSKEKISSVGILEVNRSGICSETGISLEGENRVANSSIKAAESLRFGEGHSDVQSSSLEGARIEVAEKAELSLDASNVNFANSTLNGTFNATGSSGVLGAVVQEVTGLLNVVGIEGVSLEGDKTLTGFQLSGAELRGKTNFVSTVITSTEEIHSTGLLEVKDAVLTNDKNIRLEGQTHINNSLVKAADRIVLADQSDVQDSILEGSTLEIANQSQVRLEDSQVAFNKTVEDGSLNASGSWGTLGKVQQGASGDLKVIGKEIEGPTGEKGFTGVQVDGAELSGAVRLESTVIHSTQDVRGAGQVDVVQSAVVIDGSLDLEGENHVTNSVIEVRDVIRFGDKGSEVRQSDLKATDLRVAEKANVNLIESAVQFKTTTVDGVLSAQNTSGKLGEVHESKSASLALEGEVIRDASQILYQQQLELNGGNFLGKVKLNGIWVDSAQALEFAGGADISGSHVTSGQDILFQQGSQATSSNSVFVAENIIQEQGSHLTANNVDLSATQKISLAGGALVQNRLLLQAGNSVDLTQTSTVARGENSALLLQADTINKAGSVDVNQVQLAGHLSSQQVNNLLADNKLKTDDLEVITDQSVDISTRITSADQVTIVGKNVQSNVAQSVTSLSLESTEGDVKINERISATNNIVLISDRGKVTIESSLTGGGEVYLDGTKGIDIKTNVPATDPSYYTSSHRFSNHQKIVLPEKTQISGAQIDCVSNGNLTLLGVDIFYQDFLNINIKGDVIDAEVNYKYLSAWGAKMVQAYKSALVGPNLMVNANNFKNYGQTIQTETSFFKLASDLFNIKGGYISATHFLSIEAKNVINECGTRTVAGSFGRHVEYIFSVMSGGSGVDTQGVGLAINATGKVTVDASYISSIGSNYIVATDDIEILARSNTYCSYRHDESSFFGLNQDHKEVYETTVGRSGIISQQGENVISSEEGSLTATATDFVAQNGTYIHSRNNAEFYDLVGHVEEKSSKQNLGIFHSDEERYDEFSSPTVIMDQTGITLVCESDIKARGVNIITPGKFYVQAKNFEMTVSKLEHSYRSSSFGMSATLCNQEFLRTNNPCNFSSPLFVGDSTWCQFNQLAHSNGALEIGLNAWSTGINLANTGNALLNGLRTNTLLQEGLKRYFPSVYAPQLGVNFTWTSVSSSSQSLGEGGIFVGSADFEVEDMVTLKGVLAQSLNDFIVNCRNFTLEGERLRSESSQKTTNLNFTVSAKGDPYQVGISHSECENVNDVQAGATLQVGGKLVVNADTMIVDGSTIDTKQIAGNVKTLNIISRQDEAHCSSQAICISSGGDFCVSEQRAESRVVNNPAGIHVQDSINGNNKEFVVGTLNSTGGKITSDGVNNFVADKVNAKDVEDYQKTSGFSACGNVKDFKQDIQTNHLLPPDRQSALITTTNLNFNNCDYAAKNHTVIHGAGGTHLDVKETSGKVITANSDGKEVTKDSSHSYNVVIPHMTEETKVQFRKNGKWAAEMVGRAERKMSDFFKPASGNCNSVSNDSSSYTNFGKRHSYESSKKQGQVTNSASKTEKGDYLGDLKVEEQQVAVSPGEAYARGKSAGISGRVPDYVNTWPEELQGQFYLGMGEGQGTKWAPLFAAGVGILACDVAVDLVVVGLRTFGLFKKAVKVSDEIIEAVEHNFASDEFLERHFTKHGSEFKGAYDSAEEYLNGARDVINDGIPVFYKYDEEMRIGYIRFMGTSEGKVIFDDLMLPGRAKFEFVGTNQDGNITTYFISSGKSFWKTLNGNSFNKNIQPYEFPKLEDIPRLFN